MTPLYRLPHCPFLLGTDLVADETFTLAHCLDETFVEQILSLQSSLDTMLGDRLEAVSASGEASCSACAR